MWNIDYVPDDLAVRVTGCHSLQDIDLPKHQLLRHLISLVEPAIPDV